MSPKPVSPALSWHHSLALFFIVTFLGTVITPHPLSIVIDKVSFAPISPVNRSTPPFRK